ncbi:uncharacterized protein FTOL_07408 [Fusarium torulosum]|uniref:Uncharacterized protein n=1 Tax=Fusarium torulosum TaxID=33205 RepID=A0AAE8MBU0_9HYPO|nr:uncharacterized protein FTOL_07408 [Fusarium torulosum]
MSGIIINMLQALWELFTRPVRFGLDLQHLPAPLPLRADASLEIPTSQAPAPARSAVGSPIPERPPPPYQQAASSEMWCVWLEFTSDRAKIPLPHKKIDSSSGWFAELVLWAPDIVGLMRDGLYVTEEDVDIEKNHTTEEYCPRYERRMIFRHYRLKGPKWSGYLIVKSVDIHETINFRIQHLSYDKAIVCYVQDKKRNPVYVWLHLHDSNTNNLFDDKPLEGLWPWPRKELAGKEADDEGKRKE